MIQIQKIPRLMLTAIFLLAGISAANAQNIIDTWKTITVPPPPELQPATVDATHTALLILDVSAANCTEAQRPSCARSIPFIQHLLTDARSHHMLVVYSGGPANANSTPIKTPDALTPKPDDPVVRAGADKFIGSDLDKILAAKEIKTIIVTGTSSQGAVLYTASSAALRGIAAIVPVDGSSSETPFGELSATWQLKNAPATISRNITLTKADMITMQEGPVAQAQGGPGQGGRGQGGPGQGQGQRGAGGAGGAGGQQQSPPTAGMNLDLMGGNATYTVSEQFVGIDFPSDAIGASSKMAGTLNIAKDGSIVPGSKLTVDLTALKSDQDMRDTFAKTRTLEVDKFPSAEFVPTKIEGLPLMIPTNGQAGFRLTGNMTIHGVTKEVTFQGIATFNNRDSTISGVAKTSFGFDTFGLAVPKIGRLASVDNKINLELQFQFKRS